MKERYGTLNVREAYLSRREVEQMLHETLFHRGPRSYDFDYRNPIFIWNDDGDVTIRWPSRDLRAEPGRAPSSLQLVPLEQFIAQEATRLQRAKSKPPPPAQEPPPTAQDTPPGDASGTSKP